MAFAFNDNKSKSEMGRSGKFVTYTHTVMQLKDNWHSEEFTAEEVAEIFGTNDVKKIHIIAIDEWLNTGNDDGGTWTTQPGYFMDRWYSFPRYDLHPTSGRIEIISYDPLMTVASRQLTWRLLAFVEN